MIIKEIFYAVECDVCEAYAESHDGPVFWSTQDTTEENAMECEWHKEGDCHYCPDCHSFNDKDELIINFPPSQEEDKI